MKCPAGCDPWLIAMEPPIAGMAEEEKHPMRTATNRCTVHRLSLALLTLLAIFLPTAARAAHENIVIDGNLTDLITAVNNNLGPDKGGFTATDPLGEIYPVGGCSYVNGYDIRQTYVFLDFKDAMGGLTPNDISLYAGWDMEGIVGDVDGDGNPNTFSGASPGAACGAFADGSGIGADESYNVLLDLDCAGSIDDIRIQIKNNQVLKVVGGVSSVVAGAQFAFSGDKLELKIPNYQTLIAGLPVTSDLCDARIRLLANAEFDFLGEDLTSAYQLEVAPAILVEKNPPTQDICAGESIDWTITVTNTGLCRLDDVTVEDILGAGMTFGSSNVVPTSVVGQTIRWEYPNIKLLPGQTINLTLTATTMSPCPSPVLTNNVTVEGAHFNPCLGAGAPPATANSKDSASVNCRDLPACDITGDPNTCFPSTETYSTAIGAPYTRAWSVTSTPPGICNTSSPLDGSSISVNFTGAGVCTVTLTITDPLNPQVCQKVCTQIVTVNPKPPCGIEGDDHTCFPASETYSTNVGPNYTKAWSVTSNPPGICATNGALDGDQLTVDFTGAGSCTVSLTVTDPNDPTDCVTVCTKVVNVNALPPCDISGDLSTCLKVPGPTTETYTTTVGAEYNRQWSVVSEPADICNFTTPTNGGSVGLNFTGTGVCTLTLTVTDPNDPNDCGHVCSQIITVNPTPPCNIEGDLHTCFPSSETYTTTVGDEYTRVWSATSTPPGICNIPGSTSGSSVTVDFTGAGSCTLKLEVFDPNDPTDCLSVCTLVIESDPQPPCDITGDLHLCLLDSGPTTETYSTSVGAAYNKQWSFSSDPGGICFIDGPADGDQVTVNFTGAGQCTVTLRVTDPMDPEDCIHECSQVITIDPLPPCDISGDLFTCLKVPGPTTETYTTTVGAQYNRVWSATSTPPGICNIPGSTTDGSVTVNFTGTGVCTLTLTVTDPNDPNDCGHVCSQIITVNPTPPCDIQGDDHTCFPSTETYTTTVDNPNLKALTISGLVYTKLWSATSTPPGICEISGPTDGPSVTVNFTGAGTCTLKLEIFDPNDPTDCLSVCTKIIESDPLPPCDISGDASTCLLVPGPTTETYTTTVGAEYNRQWSATSNPPGICNIPGATDGGSVTVNFTGAGTCTLTLTVTDPTDPNDCGHVCTQIIDVLDTPPCDISGDDHTCFPSSETYTTTVGANYTRAWSATSTPPGICNIPGATDGGSVTVNFTGAGTCTLTLTVSDPNDPDKCLSTCTKIIESDPLPPCDITGDLHTCLMNPGPTTETYTTTVGAEYNRLWSVTSTPPGICTTSGPLDGGSVTVNFTGAGQCTVKLTVTDPADPTDCIHECTQVVTVAPQPPCDISGDASTCLLAEGPTTETYTTTVGDQYNRQWSATSTPPGICNIPGDKDGSSVLVNFTGAGTCTLTLTVIDPNDREDCGHVCTQIIEVTDTPPCNISGDDHTCFPSSETYTTTVGAEYNRQWSATSNPPGICNIPGATDGGSVTVNFTGAGSCTLTLTVSDPSNPDKCFSTCTKIIESDPLPPCDISGDTSTCFPMSETYTTTVGAEFNRQWSVTSNPPGICTTSGPLDGGSVTVNFTGAGQCTVKLIVTDPADPTDCVHECTQIVDVKPQPPCNISGDASTCLMVPGPTSETYTTTVGAEYNRQWSATSNPPGICNIPGATDGGSVTVNFTGTGVCTLTLTVTDPNDPDDCGHVCMQIIQVLPTPPCNIAGDDQTCFPSSETYTTTVGSGYTKVWSATSTPGGICNIPGPTNGNSVTINFTGAGTCTLKLEIYDPADPTDCLSVCTKIIESDPQPPCNIAGPATASIGSTVAVTTTLNPGDYDLSWSAISDPDGICSIVGPTTDVASINVTFTGAGACTVTLEVTDPANPEVCASTCSIIITVEPNQGFACPHTIGFWRSQCAQRGNGSTKVCRTGMENLWRCVISETGVTRWLKNDGSYETTSTLAGLSNATLFDRLCSQLQGPRAMTTPQMAEVQYLGLMLNVCSGALPLDIEISNGFSGSVAEAIAGIENAINTGVNVGYWKDVADNINNGIGVMAVACPDGDDLFRNLPGCETDAPEVFGSANFDGVETLTTRPFPNPVTSGATSITWFIPTGTTSAAVGITIFDVAGRVVRTMDLGYQAPGEHAVDWDLRDEDGSNITSGIYFYRLTVGQETITEKLMVVRR